MRRLSDSAGTGAGAGALLWTVIALVAAAAPWLGEGIVIVAFAAISWWALRAFPLPPHRASADRALALACTLSVPLQYGFVAAHAYEPFVAVLPLATLMVLPLLALATGDTRHLLERIAERGFVVMLYVYCVAHAPALFMLDVAGFASRNGLLVAFLVLAAHAGDGVRVVLARMRRQPGTSARREGRRRAVELAVTLALGAAIGAAFALALPVSAAMGMAAGALVSALGWLGRGVLVRLRADGAPTAMSSTWAHEIARPDALCFAAPVFFHLVRLL